MNLELVRTAEVNAVSEQHETPFEALAHIPIVISLAPATELVQSAALEARTNGVLFRLIYALPLALRKGEEKGGIDKRCVWESQAVAVSTTK